MAKTKMSIDHQEIRRWAEERGGRPAEVERTERDGETGIIRIDFPGYSGAGSLKEISWDEWFEKFDASNLALLFQERTARGQKSNFNKLVGRETAEARAEGDNKASRRSLRGRGRARGGASRGGRTAARSRRSATGRASSRGGRRSTGTTSRTSRRGTGRKTGGTTRRSASSRRGGAATREAPRTVAARLTGRGRMSMGGRGGSSRRKSSSGRGATKRGGGRRTTSGRSTTRRTSRGSTGRGPRR